MEFYCHTCSDWYHTDYCKSHFESVHDQKVTFESFCVRYEAIGGLLLRDETAPEEERVFVTNNFRHVL